jgi:hypothetical protein
VGGREHRRQLVAAGLPDLGVFLGVDGVGLGEDLARDLLVVPRRLRRRVGRQLGAVDRDQPDPRLKIANGVGSRRNPCPAPEGFPRCAPAAV